MHEDAHDPQLPSVPAEQLHLDVAAWSEPVTIPTYEPDAPDPFPQFLDARVYQGSSGRVFPLPFIERIDPTPRPRAWRAIHLENRWIRIVVLPELGGRVHVVYDKTNDYDLVYRNRVIKPALVGLTGPWVSGGIEFNWPQHHRPATFLPTDVELEREPGGSVTVWCSDHDPFERMKGMHGIRLRPDSSAVELRVRLFNRSETTQTFLWWANVAAAVSADYQSFFPEDVHWVADHAKRDVVAFPHVRGRYYGVDYPARVDEDHPDADRLDWYRNIPVPTSYMVADTRDAFFGGFDHGRRAGFVHWADRAISPGKKQWTWGNAPFGWAWDRQLTDSDGPYVELMAGVYTDNQPDFAFLRPGETKSFSQFWFPIGSLGPAAAAAADGAIGVAPSPLGATVSVVSTRSAEGSIVVSLHGRELLSQRVRLEPSTAVGIDVRLPDGIDCGALEVRLDRTGCAPVVRRPVEPAGAPPARAVEPPLPADVATIEELDTIAQYLEQYRHATRSPEPYWVEALRRDPSDIRANLGLGALHHRRGLFIESAQYLRRALARQTRWAPSPPDGEVLYRLGLSLQRLGDPSADQFLARAAWNAAWVVPAGLARVRGDAMADQDAAALLQATLRFDIEHLQVRDALAVLLRRLGREDEAQALVEETLRIDPLDQWARDLAGRPLTDDATTLLDVALEYRSIGALEDALRVLGFAADAARRRPAGQVNIGPVVAAHRAVLLTRLGRDPLPALEGIAIDPVNAAALRLDDIAALEQVAALDPGIAIVWSMLGSWYYDRGRSADAVAAWRRGVEAPCDPDVAAVLERNLGLAAYNVGHDPHGARRHFLAARQVAPEDARLLYEADQLADRMDATAEARLRVLDESRALVARRDDLLVTRAGLLVATGRAEEARVLLRTRDFQPWEGGEGQVLEAWDAAAIGVARAALAAGNVSAARAAVHEALEPPESLGEARHPLATTADLHLLLGDVEAASGRPVEADRAWEVAARSSQDFAEMSATEFTPRSAWAIAALARLGRAAAADAMLDRLRLHIAALRDTPPTTPFFATSMPSMLLFRDTPETANGRRVARLEAVVEQLILDRNELISAGGAR